MDLRSWFKPKKGRMDMQQFSSSVLLNVFHKDPM